MATAVTLHGDLDFARQLTLVERGVVTRIGEALKAAGATLDEWRVLSLLSDGAGHAMTDIADYAMLRAPALTKVVDRMVSANLVHRRLDDIDRRRILVFATERGCQELQQWNAAVGREQDAIVAAVGGEEVALLMALLTRVARSLC